MYLTNLLLATLGIKSVLSIPLGLDAYNILEKRTMADAILSDGITLTSTLTERQSDKMNQTSDTMARGLGYPQSITRTSTRFFDKRTSCTERCESTFMVCLSQGGPVPSSSIVNDCFDKKSRCYQGCPMLPVSL